MGIHTKLEAGDYSVVMESDRKYSVEWQLRLEKEGIYALPSRKARIAAAKLSITKVSMHSQIVSTHWETADKIVLDTLLPLLSEFQTSTKGTLTIELEDGPLILTGWVVNCLIDRFSYEGEEMIDITFDFILSRPANTSGLGSIATDTYSYNNTTLTINTSSTTHTVELEGDRSYSIDWNLETEGQGIYPTQNRSTVVSAGQLSTTKFSLSGEVLKTSNNSPDLILWERILPALSEFYTRQSGNLKIYVGGGNFIVPGWVTFFKADREFPDGNAMFSYSMDYWMEEPPTTTGLR